MQSRTIFEAAFYAALALPWVALVAREEAMTGERAGWHFRFHGDRARSYGEQADHLRGSSPQPHGARRPRGPVGRSPPFRLEARRSSAAEDGTMRGGVPHPGRRTAEAGYAVRRPGHAVLLLAARTSARKVVADRRRRDQQGPVEDLHEAVGVRLRTSGRPAPGFHQRCASGLPPLKARRRTAVRLRGCASSIFAGIANGRQGGDGTCGAMR